MPGRGTHCGSRRLARQAGDGAASRPTKKSAGHIELRAMDVKAIGFAPATLDCVTLPCVLSVTPNPIAWSPRNAACAGRVRAS
jgi:hypothetical protein